jgi:hypothetical protein
MNGATMGGGFQRTLRQFIMNNNNNNEMRQAENDSEEYG